MNTIIKNLLLREIEKFKQLILEDKCEMTEAEAMQVVSAISHQAMSKEEVLIHTGWSRAKFDDYCNRGLMPKGKKRAGFKELVWYKDEINDALIFLKNKYNM